MMVACAALVVSTGCSGGPSRIKPPGIDASAAGSGAMDKYDTNKDGAISGEELDKAPALKSAMERIDADKDGKITAAEVTGRVKQWQESRLGLTSVSCQVNLDGQPLADATVTYLPEEFLGGEVQKATGKTGPSGVVLLSVENPPEPNLTGVHPGLYKVQISKLENGKEIVPAKYNTETTLGEEVAIDSRGAQEGIVYNLTSK
jgi:hypothetical protein